MNKKKYFGAIAILSGTCIGAGFLGIPYVAAKAGFFTVLGYLFLIGGIILLMNLYLGEVILRTKGNHQLTGYAQKYLGKKARKIMLSATQFLIYSALVAYMLGVGESVSFLIFGNTSYELVFGVGFGVIMAFFIRKGISFEKKIEKLGISGVFLILILMFFMFFGKIDYSNLLTFDAANLFLPFGIILFSSMSFFALPEVSLSLGKDKKMMKRVILIGTLLPLVFYALFTFLVIGFKGAATPQIVTLSLGPIFILLGIITMLGSYFALGLALQETYNFDLKYSENKSWIFAVFFPILIFIFTRLFDFFSFVNILSIAGVVSGGIIGMLILLIVRKSKKLGNRKAEFNTKINKFIIGLIFLLFIFGMIQILL